MPSNLPRTGRAAALSRAFQLTPYRSRPDYTTSSTVPQTYYGARYYDKVLLGWTQADPLYLRVPDLASRSTPRRSQTFMFSLNNPNRYLDPDGLDVRGSHAGNLSSYRSQKEQGDSYRTHLLADENWMARRVSSSFGGAGGGCAFGGPVGGYGGCNAWNEEGDIPTKPPEQMPLPNSYARGYADYVLDFDENGIGQGTAAGILGLQSFHAQDAWNEAKRVSERVFSGKLGGLNDAEDAFRHAYASYVLTKSLGSEAAKMVGDAHERSFANQWSERLMDLYNNHVGRSLAKTRDSRTPELVILDALRRGLLLRTPPNITGSRPESYSGKYLIPYDGPSPGAKRSPGIQIPPPR